MKSHFLAKSKIFKYFTILIIVFFCIATGCTSSSKWKIVHPLSNRFPSDSTVDYHVDVSHQNKNPIAHLISIDLLQQIGTISTKGNTAFNDNYYFYGFPPKMDIDPKGNIYILQKHTNSIRVFNKHGHYLYQIGRGGRGPGEFMYIRSFAFDSTYQNLYVADRSYKIAIFTLKNNRYQYHTSLFPNMIFINDLCVLGNDLYVSGYKIAREDIQAYKSHTKHIVFLKAAKPINRINLKTLKSDLSFGYVYKSFSGAGAYNARLSQTLLGCNEITGTVVSELINFPYIFGYSRNGHLKWTSKMDGYKSIKFIESKKPGDPIPGIYPWANNYPFNWKFPIEPINDGPYLLMQYGWELPSPYYRPSNVSFKFNPEHKTVVVDTRTGELFYSDGYPVIGMWKQNTVITTTIEGQYEKNIIQLYEQK